MKTAIFPRLAYLYIWPLMLLSACASGPPKTPDAILLWPNGAPGSEGHTAPERTYIRHEAATADTPDVSFPVVTDINDPSITPFLPDKDKATGIAVIIAPGGGHMFLSINHEGYDVGRYLAAHGVAGFVLKYRLARAENSPYSVQVHALMDAQRAIRLIRSRAAEWGVDPHKIGILGFSAGGEVAMLSATRYGKPVPGSNDAVDQFDCKPDFQALLYPGGLNNPSSIPVDKDTPPAFLCCTNTDPSRIPANLAAFYLVLKAAGVPVELHIYGSGGHGWGVRPTGRPAATWTDRFMDWMGDRGLLKSS
jgi:endo-1,4-beta-xylanase